MEIRLKRVREPCYQINADLISHRSSLPSASKEVAIVKGSFVLPKKAPSIMPSSFFSYVVNGSGALLGRFGNFFFVSNQQLKEYASRPVPLPEQCMAFYTENLLPRLF